MPLPIGATKLSKSQNFAKWRCPDTTTACFLRGNMDSIVKQSSLVRKAIHRNEYDIETSHPTARFAISIE
jgi:hypothetical protein